MDAQAHADAILARAQARSRDIVTPASATSPMDAAATQQLPRITASVTPDATVVTATDRLGRFPLGRFPLGRFPLGRSPLGRSPLG